MFLPWKNCAFIQQFCFVTQSKPQQTSKSIVIEFKCKENGSEMDNRIRTCSQLHKMVTEYFICIRILVLYIATYHLDKLVILQIHKEAAGLPIKPEGFPACTTAGKQGTSQLEDSTDSLELPLGTATEVAGLAYMKDRKSHSFAFTENFDRTGIFP